MESIAPTTVPAGSTASAAPAVRTALTASTAAAMAVPAGSPARTGPTASAAAITAAPARNTGTTAGPTANAGAAMALPAKSMATVTGPTVSMLPDAFFKRGVTTLGGIAVTDADELLDLLCEGGSGYHFFGKSAQQTIVRPKK